MGYFVKREFNNGYRCCCYSAWENEEDLYFDDRDTALREVPLRHERSEFCELDSITVIDGSTGGTIAEARLEWTAHERGQGYSHWRWYGHVDGTPFEQLVGNLDGESWDQMCTRLLTVAHAARIKRAEDELLLAKQELEALKKST